MKIKYFLAGLLCVCLGTSMMTACANPQSAQSSEAQEVKTEKLHKLWREQKADGRFRLLN